MTSEPHTHGGTDAPECTTCGTALPRTTTVEVYVSQLAVLDEEAEAYWRQHPDLEDFDWPCDKREAHGPHTRLVPYGTKMPEGTLDVLLGFNEVDCPGVRAHPLTQIGGSYR